METIQNFVHPVLYFAAEIKSAKSMSRYKFEAAISKQWTHFQMISAKFELVVWKLLQVQL